MVDILEIGSSKIDDKLADIDKSVKITFFKKGKVNLTYVNGVHDFMDESTLNEFMKKMQKTLGTHMIKVLKDDDGKKLVHPIYAFGGDHREQIIKDLMEKGKIPKDKIK